MAIIKHKCSNSILLACTLILSVISASISLVASTIGHALGAVNSTTGWTVAPGGPVTGNAPQPTLHDTNTNTTLNCQNSATAATLKSGSGLTNPIGQISSVTFASCMGPGGLVFTMATSASSANPWSLVANSYNASTGVTTGEITNITASIEGSNCSALINGTTPTSPGEVTSTFTNNASTLKISGGDLRAWDVNGCLGLINNGDLVSFNAIYKISPPQTVLGW